MKKTQILIACAIFLCGAFVGRAQQEVSNGLDLLAAPSDTTQNITQTGYYRITVRGADGGITSVLVKGGSGATVAATFLLEAGDVLTLVRGIAGDIGFGGGGGGGSAVILTRGGVPNLLIVAGAGGGGANGSGGGGGGNSAQGTAGGGTASNAGGGGGGFNANGGSAPFSGGGGAGTLSGGGAGGGGSGGYGFGGGGGGSITGSGGGGGGYGGGNAPDGQSGRGGSSYVDASGTNVTRTDGTAGGSTNQSGSIRVVATTAASVSISGRVLIGANRGLMNAIVYLTDAAGTTRTARTSSFGYYRFEDVQAGQAVIITIVSKRYQFAPRVFTVTEEIENLNFVASAPHETPPLKLLGLLSE